MKNKTFFVLMLFVFPIQLFALDYNAVFKKVLSTSGISEKTKLSDTKIGQGLKEALKVGAEKTVELTGKKDGYFSNDAIKILMPEKLKTADTLLRKVGMGPKLDEFVLSMNRAAEKAAPAARDIFINAITDLSLEDVQKIYQGGDTAATQYFQSKTTSKLVEAYRPIVEKAMGDYGVTQRYQSLISKMPLAKNFDSLNIENHVVNKALAGLFKTLGEQEKLIRQDPKAQVTSLLKEVFGKS